MAEGGGLLNRYTVISRIVGSNPIPSANQALGAYQPAANRYRCAGKCADSVPSAFAPEELGGALLVRRQEREIDLGRLDGEHRA